MKHIINSIVILVLLLPVRLGACAHRADTSGHVAPLAEEAALGIPDTDSSLLTATVWPTPARRLWWLAFLLILFPAGKLRLSNI